MNVKFILYSFFSVALLFTFGVTTNECQAQTQIPFSQKNHQNDENGENTKKKTGNLLDVLKGVADAVKPKNIAGTWSYIGIDMKIKGDDILSRVGGQLASQKLEQNLDAQLQKAGIQPGRYVLTFREDGTYTAKIGKRDVEGKYTFEKENGMIVMTPRHALTHSEMMVEMKGDGLSLLYDSSKFLDVVKGISGAVGKNSSLKIFDSLLQKCKGMYVGMKFDKQ